MKNYQELINSELYKNFKKAIDAGSERTNVQRRTIYDARSKFQFIVERDPEFSHKSLLDLGFEDFDDVSILLNDAFRESMRLIGHDYGFRDWSSFGTSPQHWRSEKPSDSILLMFEHLPTIDQTMNIIDLFYRVDDFWFSTGTWTIRFSRQGETREEITKRVQERLDNPIRIS